tara:strand:+ start:1590 stop:1748 length:159 start_codon:yes stop_codon:yes gene_type:complete
VDASSQSLDAGQVMALLFVIDILNEALAAGDREGEQESQERCNANEVFSSLV